MPRCDIPAPRNSLVSFHYFADYDLDRLSNLRLIGDSGAYSARMKGVEISNEQLGEWILKWEHRLAWAACMDVSGDIELTRKNWHALLDMGIESIPSIHMGTDPSEMDYYAERGVDYMGLGGVAGGDSAKASVFRWLIAVFKYAQKNHPQMRFHGWGITAQSWLRLPFFSVDSSSWGSSYRYGQLILRDPRTFKRVTMNMNGKDVYDRPKAKLLSNHYGVAPSEVATSIPSNRHKIVRLSALSASLQEQSFRKMHPPISHPTWGVLGGAKKSPIGPHLHIAEGHHRHLEIVDEMVQAEDGILLDGPHLHLAEASKPNLEELNLMAGAESPMEPGPAKEYQQT
jgi:hypothetical protein